MIYEDINLWGENGEISNLILVQFPLYVQGSSSLELDTVGHQHGPLKRRSPSLTLPPSAMVQAMRHLALVWDLIRDPVSAKAEHKCTVSLEIPDFSSVQKGVMGPWWPSSLPNIIFASILLQKQLSLKILRLTCLNIQMIWIQTRLKELLIWKKQDIILFLKREVQIPWFSNSNLASLKGKTSRDVKHFLIS